MTHRRNDQSYEDALDDAVHDMHLKMPRGNQPSGRAWSLFAAEAGIPNENATDKQPSFHSSIAKDRPAGPRMTRVTSPTEPGSHLGWSTWLAVALVLIVVGASANFLMPDNNDNNRSEHSIALAPGTPDMSVFPQLQVATPFASPGAYLPEYGPEYACHAEPLTEDQVFDIVMNPLREHARRGSETQGPNLDKPYEPSHWSLNRYLDRPSNSTFTVVEDPELQQSLKGAANQFWNCLMTGTAFQVWALMDPSNVQREILELYPVIRDEATLRQHIVEWGPRRYSEALHRIFADVGRDDPQEEAMYADESWGSVLGTGQTHVEEQPTWARVRIVPHEDSTRPVVSSVHLDMIRAADGTWWVRSVLYNQD